MYPSDWPKCPGCGEPALDGHITCGDVTCDEREWRKKRDEERRARAKGPSFTILPGEEKKPS